MDSVQGRASLMSTVVPFNERLGEEVGVIDPSIHAVARESAISVGVGMFTAGTGF